MTDLAHAGAADPKAFEGVDGKLASLVIPYDEWETVYRLRLQVENEARLPDASAPAGKDATRSGLPASGATSGRTRTGAWRARKLEWAAVASVVGLFALDVALMID